MKNTSSNQSRQLCLDARTYRQLQLVSILQNREIEEVIENYTRQGIQRIMAGQPSLRVLTQLPSVRTGRVPLAFESELSNE